MKIVPALQCASLDGWYPVNVSSSEDPDHSYVVHVNPWANRSELHVCECKGYQFRGVCRHQKIAHEQHCGWNEMDGPEKVTDEQRRNRQCPRCEGPAVYAMWESPDES